MIEYGIEEGTDKEGYVLTRSDSLYRDPGKEQSPPGGFLLGDRVEALTYTFFDETGKEYDNWNSERGCSGPEEEGSSRGPDPSELCQRSEPGTSHSVHDPDPPPLQPSGGPMRSDGSNRRGVALIIVLLMISIIIAVTLQLNRDTRSEVYEAANLSDGIRLRYVAESGFYVGEALILADKNASDALTDLWANTEMISLKSESFFDNASFRLLIEDEGGRISINRLVSGNGYNPLIRDLLLRLLTGPSFRLEQTKAVELLDAIKDWIDADDEVTGGGCGGGLLCQTGKAIRRQECTS